MSADQKLIVEQLDVDNYATWSIRMKALLISKGLWTPVVEATPTDATLDQKALAQIILHVRDHHLQTLASCSTSKAAWDTLQATYEAKTNARKLMLRRELTNMKMGATEPLSKYAARAKDIQAQLKSAGDNCTSMARHATAQAACPRHASSTRAAPAPQQQHQQQ